MKSPLCKTGKFQAADKTTLKLKDKAKLLVGLPLILQLCVVICLMFLMHDAEVKQAQKLQADAIIFEAGNLQRTMHDAGIAIGGYSITRSTIYGERAAHIVDEAIPAQLEKLKQVVQGNPRQEAAMARLERETNIGMKMLQNARRGIADSSQAMGFRRVRDLYNELKDVTNNMGREIDSITSESQAIQEATAGAWEQSKWFVRFFMFLALGGNLLIAFGLYTYFNSSITKRLALVAENVSRALKHESLARTVTGRDEIAELDKNVHALANQMLDSSVPAMKDSATGQQEPYISQSIKPKDEINQV